MVTASALERNGNANKAVAALESALKRLPLEPAASRLKWEEKLKELRAINSISTADRPANP